MQLTSETYTWNAAGNFGLYSHHEAYGLFPSASLCLLNYNVEEDGGQADLRYLWVLHLVGNETCRKTRSTTQDDDGRSQFLQLLHCKEHQHCVSATPKAKKRHGKGGTRDWEMDHATNCSGDKSFMPAPEKIWEKPVVESGSTFLAFKPARSLVTGFSLQWIWNTLSGMVQVCSNAKRCFG